ncbi:MAG: restriction endonuclease subunit S [Bacteroidales bacterium]|jgi:restriction endonuclease S subunit
MQYSVVNYKTVRENSDFRIDAEYYRQYFFDLLSKISQKKNFALSEISSNKTKRFKGDYDFEYLEISNISTADASCIYQFLSKEETPSRAQKILKNKDVVISTVRPNRNAVSFINEIEGLKVASSGFCVLRNFRNVLPEYIFILFKTYIFRDLLDRETKATMYPAVSEEDILNLRIPIFSLNFQKKIAGIVLELFKKQNQSKSLYSQAEQLLLSELGLLDWKPKHTLAFVKNFSDTQKAERIDAEYFQPKYEEIIEAVKKYKGGYDELGNLVKINDKNFTPKDNEQYKYIELANISSNGEINGYTENFGNELPSRARRKVQKGDLVISTIEGSLESIALITEDWKNALCSTGFFVVNSNKLNPETLLVLLKTKVGQMQLKKGCKGTILTAIDKNELSKIVLPKIDSKTQEEIKAKITEMYEAKKLSKSLLEIAKRGVEIAIEKDEQEAEEWIESEIEKLGVKIQ